MYFLNKLKVSLQRFAELDWTGHPWLVLAGLIPVKTFHYQYCGIPPSYSLDLEIYAERWNAYSENLSGYCLNQIELLRSIPIGFFSHRSGFVTIMLFLTTLFIFCLCLFVAIELMGKLNEEELNRFSWKETGKKISYMIIPWYFGIYLYLGLFFYIIGGAE